MTETSGRFIKVRSLEDEQGTEIWIDRETGVNYVFHSRGSAEGFTPLLDAEGNPVIAPLTADQLFGCGICNVLGPVNWFQENIHKCKNKREEGQNCPFSRFFVCYYIAMMKKRR